MKYIKTGVIAILNINMPNHNAKKILLVDDEEDILNVLETVLMKEGFQHIYKASNGTEALTQAQKLNPDIIILDIMLPDMDGYEVCRQIRTFSYAPIIFLSAKADDVDKLLGLGMGGDDYMTKPFSPKEVAYRIKAQFRRMSYADHSDSIHKQECISFGDIAIYPEQAEVTKDSEVVTLTALEYQLLLFFVRHPNQILSKEILTEKVWGNHFEGNDNALMVHIHRLRQKIETNPAKPIHILTQRGLGYKFNPENKV